MSHSEAKRPDRPDSHFDPTDELSAEEIKECNDKALEEHNSTHSKELVLEKSTEWRVPGQDWALVSFVGKDCEQKTDILGMKIWGVFETAKEAKERAASINKSPNNKYYNIYILELYTWAAIPPDAECIKDQVHHDDKLDNIISQHRLHQLKAKEMFHMRKNKLQNNEDINEHHKKRMELEGITEEEIYDDENKQLVENIFAAEELPKLTVEEIKDDDSKNDSDDETDALLN